MSPALKTTLYKDAATFHSEFGANVFILITPSAHTPPPPRARSKQPTPFLSACNRKKINQQFWPRSLKPLCAHEELKPRGVIEIQSLRRNLIPPHRMSARKGSAGRRQLHRAKSANLWLNGTINNAKLNGKMWAAVGRRMFSYTDAIINQIFNTFIGICKHGKRFDSKRGLTVNKYLHINNPAA